MHRAGCGTCCNHPPPATPQASDLVIHTHCQALSWEQQRAGATELARMLRRSQEETYPDARLAGSVRLLISNALCKVSQPPGLLEWTLVGCPLAA